MNKNDWKPTLFGILSGIFTLVYQSGILRGSPVAQSVAEIGQAASISLLGFHAAGAKKP